MHPAGSRGRLYGLRIDRRMVHRVLPPGGTDPLAAARAAGPVPPASQTPAAQASGLRAEVHSAILHPLPATFMLKEVDALLAFLAEAMLQPVTAVFTGKDQEDQDGALIVNLLVVTVGRERRRCPAQSHGDAGGRNWWLWISFQSRPYGVTAYTIDFDREN